MGPTWRGIWWTGCRGLRAWAHFKQLLRNALTEDEPWIYAHGDDMSDIGDWTGLDQP